MLVVASPAIYFAVYAGSTNLAMMLLGIPTISPTFYYGPCFSIVQALASDHARAPATAISLLFSGLCGLCFGPVFVGFLSGYFAVGVSASEGRTLQKAMVVTGLFNLSGAFHFWRAQTCFNK